VGKGTGIDGIGFHFLSAEYRGAATGYWYIRHGMVGIVPSADSLSTYSSQYSGVLIKRYVQFFWRRRCYERTPYLILTVLICSLCGATTLGWFFHKGIYPRDFHLNK
jgi:hypothetical protein